MRQIFDLTATISERAAEADLRHRRRDFSRGGTLSPSLMVTMLLYMAGDANRRGYRHMLDAFWDQCAEQGVPLPTESPVTASAFCQARAKVSTDMLRLVVHETSAVTERTFRKGALWEKRRTFAIDGSKFNLQRSPELDARFGRPHGGHCPQVTVSTLLNVANGVPYDIVVGPYGASERELLLDHLAVLRRGDVVVLDRGYPSHEVLRILLDHGVDFLVRVPASHTFDAIEAFKDSEGLDYRVVIPPASDPECGREAIALRAIKLTNPQNEDAYFLTSLRRCDYSRAKIAALYRKRWEVEEHYKLEKSSYFDQHQFHARSALGVRQEILVQAIYIGIARFMMAMAAEHADVDCRDLSTKSAVLALAEYVVRLFIGQRCSAPCWMRRLLERIARTRDLRRPGRSCPRRSFKPGPRWGPKGRRGA